MKKLLVAFLGLALLAGCSEETVDTNEDNAVDTENVDVEENVTIEENAEKGANSTEVQSDIKSFPEFIMLAKNIDLTKYIANVETDNEGTRVIFFENSEGHKEYKSIFVKNENRLKIIKLDDDGLIFNEIIN
ncbi:lipoprotein [Psychrobacillus sp. FJAT-51614]|uniref:Lipoprotein n=1 Tax=Psychrobacillus mangrovi TaxID=3117745 RepID=A0ABU8F482_9BACI